MSCVLYIVYCILYCALYTVHCSLSGELPSSALSLSYSVSPSGPVPQVSVAILAQARQPCTRSNQLPLHGSGASPVDFDPKATSFALAMAAPVADLQQLLNTMAVLPQAMTANAQIAASVPAEGGSKDGGKGRYIHQRLTARSRSSTGARKSERSSTSTWAPQGVPGAAQYFEDH